MEGYEVLHRLGEGAQGRIYLVREAGKGREWVMKMVQLPPPWPQRAAFDDAVKEGSTMAYLHHPCIVSCKESFVHDEQTLCIVMEHCQGGDLSSRVKQQSQLGLRFSEAQVLCWFVHMVLALEYLHKQHILHRDIKSENVFLQVAAVGPEKVTTTAQLGDFGIARVLESTDAFASTFVGTPYYMSPELFHGERYDFKSDIWALGCVLYEMLNLHQPFRAKNFAELASEVTCGRFPPVCDRYSLGLRALATRLLSTNPSHRPRAAEILEVPFIKEAAALYMGGALWGSGSVLPLHTDLLQCNVRAQGARLNLLQPPRSSPARQQPLFVQQGQQPVGVGSNRGIKGWQSQGSQSESGAAPRSAPRDAAAKKGQTASRRPPSRLSGGSKSAGESRVCRGEVPGAALGGSPTSWESSSSGEEYWGVGPHTPSTEAAAIAAVAAGAKAAAAAAKRVAGRGPAAAAGRSKARAAREALVHSRSSLLRAPSTPPAEALPGAQKGTADRADGGPLRTAAEAMPLGTEVDWESELGYYAAAPRHSVRGLWALREARARRKESSVAKKSPGSSGSRRSRSRGMPAAAVQQKGARSAEQPCWPVQSEGEPLQPSPPKVPRSLRGAPEGYGSCSSLKSSPAALPPPPRAALAQSPLLRSVPLADTPFPQPIPPLPRPPVVTVRLHRAASAGASNSSGLAGHDIRAGAATGWAGGPRGARPHMPHKRAHLPTCTSPPKVPGVVVPRLQRKGGPRLLCSEEGSGGSGSWEGPYATASDAVTSPRRPGRAATLAADLSAKRPEVMGGSSSSSSPPRPLLQDKGHVEEAQVAGTGTSSGGLGGASGSSGFGSSGNGSSSGGGSGNGSGSGGEQGSGSGEGPTQQGADGGGSGSGDGSGKGNKSGEGTSRSSDGTAHCSGGKSSSGSGGRKGSGTSGAGSGGSGSKTSSSGQGHSSTPRSSSRLASSRSPSDADAPYATAGPPPAEVFSQAPACAAPWPSSGAQRPTYGAAAAQAPSSASCRPPPLLKPSARSRGRYSLEPSLAAAPGWSTVQPADSGAAFASLGAAFPDSRGRAAHHPPHRSAAHPPHHGNRSRSLSGNTGGGADPCSAAACSAAQFYQPPLHPRHQHPLQPAAAGSLRYGHTSDGAVPGERSGLGPLQARAKPDGRRFIGPPDLLSQEGREAHARAAQSSAAAAAWWEAGLADSAKVKLRDHRRKSAGDMPTAAEVQQAAILLQAEGQDSWQASQHLSAGRAKGSLPVACRVEAGPAKGVAAGLLPAAVPAGRKREAAPPRPIGPLKHEGWLKLPPLVSEASGSPPAV